MVRGAITFDFHDTLVHCDTWFQLEIRTLPSAFLGWHERERGGFAPPSVAPALERAYRRLRMSIIEHGHELSAERSLALIFDQAGYHVSPSDIVDGTSELMCQSLADARPVAGAIDVVTALSDAGIDLGVVSSAVYHPFLEWSLARFGIRDRFGAVVTSADCGYYKSRPEIYWIALRALAATPHRSVHVGDSPRFDVEGAARAGMRTAWLQHAHAAKTATLADLTLTTLSDSVPSLRALFEAIAK